MTRAELVALIHSKESFLCVGLDTDPKKLPDHLKGSDEGILTFNKAIIEATLPFTVSYKLNLAFYEAMGAEGWELFEQTVKMIPNGQAFVIADAKRGDIGNTANQYANAFFNQNACDGVTINPYMGSDSITPFLGIPERWAIVLGLTSNPGSKDIELLRLDDGRFVFESVMKTAASLGSEEDTMFVVGATRGEHFDNIRAVAPNHFLLVPGVGAQGGTIEDIQPLMTADVGLLVNSSRGIIYASSGSNFAEMAGQKAREMQEVMCKMIKA